MFTAYSKWSFYGVFTVQPERPGQWSTTRCTDALLRYGKQATFPTAEVARRVVDLHERDGVSNYLTPDDGFSWDDPNHALKN
jgi:hypothetical protein